MKQTNERLCTLAQQGDTAALESLIENNKSFIGKMANDLFRSMNLAQSGLNLDTDDLNWFCFEPLDIRSMACLLSLINKKGYGANHTLLSGEPERPRRSNYPFNGGFVSQKTLVSKCESAVFISLLTYIIHDFQKKSTGNIYKIFFLNQVLDLIILP